MDVSTIIKTYYNAKIQTTRPVIDEIAKNSYPDKKMLVFGLGYDSNLWYNLTGKNTFFVEDNQAYIDLNKSIHSSHIIHHVYSGITVPSSFKLTDTAIGAFGSLRYNLYRWPHWMESELSWATLAYILVCKVLVEGRDCSVY
jgi:hypothetical protein